MTDPLVILALSGTNPTATLPNIVKIDVSFMSTALKANVWTDAER